MSADYSWVSCTRATRSVNSISSRLKQCVAWRDEVIGIIPKFFCFPEYKDRYYFLARKSLRRLENVKFLTGTINFHKLFFLIR